MYNELLWIFTQLADDYIVLDTETTGLPDRNGVPDIGIDSQQVAQMMEVMRIYGFSNQLNVEIQSEV